MKLFRKIRSNKIANKKIKDYLFYAIGEILLVVIGILLAVQINNWNQRRITAKKETQILKDIRAEFKSNEKIISEKQNLRVTTNPKVEKYISNISKGTANIESFKKFHQNEFMHGISNPSTGVIDALITSSEISIIKNDSIKYLLAGWKNQLGNLQENEQILWNSGIDFIQSYSNVIPDPQYKWYDSDMNHANKTIHDMMKSTEYRNKLVGFAGCNKIAITECQAVLHDINNILRLLEAEIKLKK